MIVSVNRRNPESAADHWNLPASKF